MTMNGASNVGVIGGRSTVPLNVIVAGVVVLSTRMASSLPSDSAVLAGLFCR